MLLQAHLSKNPRCSVQQPCAVSHHGSMWQFSMPHVTDWNMLHPVHTHDALPERPQAVSIPSSTTDRTHGGHMTALLGCSALRLLHVTPVTADVWLRFTGPGRRGGSFFEGSDEMSSTRA